MMMLIIVREHFLTSRPKSSLDVENKCEFIQLHNATIIHVWNRHHVPADPRRTGLSLISLPQHQMQSAAEDDGEDYAGPWV
jgi:hypothetical protein